METGTNRYTDVLNLHFHSILNVFLYYRPHFSIMENGRAKVSELLGSHSKPGSINSYFVFLILLCVCTASHART